jgi:hypothetical protein
MWVCSSLLALVFALAVMLQWFLWLVLTMSLFSGWGVIFGGLVFALQLWLLFGTAQRSKACELPRR